MQEPGSWIPGIPQLAGGLDTATSLHDVVFLVHCLGNATNREGPGNSSSPIPGSHQDEKTEAQGGPGPHSSSILKLTMWACLGGGFWLSGPC